MNISIFGIGYVGAVSSACLAALGHAVLGVDVAPDKVAMLNLGRAPIVEGELDALVAEAVAGGRLRATGDVDEAILATELSFIAVGTPSGPGGAVSLRAVEEVAAGIGGALGRKARQGVTQPGGHAGHAVVMRSTVPPGTAAERVIPILERESGLRHGEGFRYYSNPEFLREGTAVQDFRSPPLTMIGAAPGDDAAVLRQLYAAVEAPVHVVPYAVAEAAKYLANAYHAVKLAFANEAGAILAAHGVDAREAFRLFCEDRVLNISPAYLRPGFAFGGSCLPKDIRSFLALADQKSVAAPFLKQVLPSNGEIIERCFEAIARHGRQPVSLFGLAFKSGTDDLRESPYVRLAERLIGRGFDLRIFDRSVQVARLTGANRAYIDREIPHLERVMADSPEAALAGSRIAVMGHIGHEDRPAMLAALDGHTVIDLAGVAGLRDLPGIAYQGICW